MEALLTAKADEVLRSRGNEAYIKFLMEHFAEIKACTDRSTPVANNIGHPLHNHRQHCLHCGSENVYEDRVECDIVCRDCATATQYLNDDVETGVSFEDKIKMRAETYRRHPPNKGYKRINHFSEVLSQLMGRQQTKVDVDITRRVMDSIRDDRSDDKTLITHVLIRKHLKKMKLGRHYEDCYAMANGLTRQATLIKVDHLLEEDLRFYFKRIQRPFLEHKGPRRKSFLNYGYVLFQFLTMLHRPDIAAHVTLPRSKKVLVYHDDVYHKICCSLGWAFKPITQPPSNTSGRCLNAASSGSGQDPVATAEIQGIKGLPRPALITTPFPPLPSRQSRHAARSLKSTQPRSLSSS